MATSTESVTTQQLGLPEELILMLLNQEDGYFHQVPGWNLNCVLIGAVLAELSLIHRIDTDLDSLFLVDKTETGNPVLDPTLKEIAADPDQHSSQYWIERLAPLAESIIDLTLDRLVEMKILEHHDGDFWTLARTPRPVGSVGNPSDDTAVGFVKDRISRVIFSRDIPDPRDVIIICLVNTCDIFRFIFPLEPEDEERIAFICKLDVIGRSISEAVAHNLAGPLLRHPGLTRTIPTVSLRRLISNKNLRNGNVPALFAELTQEYGPVFQIKPPFVKPLIFLGGPNTNNWAHRQGRMYLRAKDYFSDFEKAYGAAGVLPSLDGADHFRLRKSLQPAYSRGRLEGQLEVIYRNARTSMADWKVGDSLPTTVTSRRMINGQISPLFVGVDTQDLIDDLMTYKERALTVHIMKVLPKILLKTPGMRASSQNDRRPHEAHTGRPYSRPASGSTTRSH